jgi:membrane associated rhomboid family serine protease
MFPRLPPATRALIAANVLMYVAQSLTARPGQPLEAGWLTVLLALQPIGPDFHLWQLVTYAFLHGSLAHIFFNMFALYMFGGALEVYWGVPRFLQYYFACVVAAGAVQLATTWLSGSYESTIGASGAVFGLLLAFGFNFPRQRILLLIPPIPMPAWLFVTLYGVIELFFGVAGIQANVAHFAHLGGMLGGAVVMLWWRLEDRLRGARRPPPW